MSVNTDDFINSNMNFTYNADSYLNSGSQQRLNQALSNTFDSIAREPNFMIKNESATKKPHIDLYSLMVVLLLVAPLTVAELYYSYTYDSYIEKGCFYLSSGNLNIITYLSVYCISSCVGIIVFSSFINSHGIINIKYDVLKLCASFILAWTLVRLVIYVCQFCEYQ